MLSLLFFRFTAMLDLNYAIEHGIIDVPAIRSRIEMEKRKELLAEHPFKPWEGKDGKWYAKITTSFIEGGA